VLGLDDPGRANGNNINLKEGLAAGDRIGVTALERFKLRALRLRKT
jgi:hypothetical protein